MVTKINLAEKLTRFDDRWNPRIIADLNDSDVKRRGTLTIELRDGAVRLGPGEMVVIPRGVEHRPVAAEEVHLMLIEPKSTRHTGDVESELTVYEYSRS